MRSNAVVAAAMAVFGGVMAGAGVDGGRAVDRGFSSRGGSGGSSGDYGISIIDTGYGKYRNVSGGTGGGVGGYGGSGGSSSHGGGGGGSSYGGGYGGTGGYGGSSSGYYGGGGGGGGHGGQGGNSPVVIVHQAKGGGGGGGGGKGGGGGGGKGNIACTICSILAPLALLGSLIPLVGFGVVTMTTTTGRRKRSLDHRVKGEIEERALELETVQQYLEETVGIDGEMMIQESLMARYLSCSGLTGNGQHCLEHLACISNDSSYYLSQGERVTSLAILSNILRNRQLDEDVKSRLHAASNLGSTSPGSCVRVFPCKASEIELLSNSVHPNKKNINRMNRIVGKSSLRSDNKKSPKLYSQKVETEQRNSKLKQNDAQAKSGHTKKLQINVNETKDLPSYATENSWIQLAKSSMRSLSNPLKQLRSLFLGSKSHQGNNRNRKYSVESRSGPDANN